MAEPFKNLINADTVRTMAAHLARAWGAFDRRRFESLAGRGIESLEMKARAMQIAAALEATLPPDFATATAMLEAALAPPPAPGGDANPAQGLAGWALWGVGEYVARRGLDEPERALAFLHAMTQRFSAEFAIRPFIARHPARVFDTLSRWTHDSSEQVRRLVSEGSRPRLPWGMRLHALVADPSPTLPLLALLQDDPSPTVRRSVANHLNDIAKDHPELVAQWVETHSVGATPQRLALLRHASRGLIKRGHARTLRAWGVGKPLRGEVDLRLAPRRARVGGQLTLEVALRSRARTPQTLAIDYAWHRLLADGTLAPKVFKGWQIELAAGEARTLTRRHSLRPVTTRRDRPGQHRIELLINGRPVAEATFTLLAAA